MKAYRVILLTVLLALATFSQAKSKANPLQAMSDIEDFLTEQLPTENLRAMAHRVFTNVRAQYLQNGESPIRSEFVSKVSCIECQLVFSTLNIRNTTSLSNDIMNTLTRLCINLGYF